MDEHQQYLQQALALAEERRGFCAPNPAVGAVVVKNGHVLGGGCHFAAGYNHAEVEALAEVGDEARGATIYVTLEPCCHWGKTPPCTELLITRGIKQVFYGFADPNPAVAEKSAAILKQAGIHSEQVEIAAISDFYRSYAHWTQTQLPWVRAKLALSLDGKIAGERGEQMTITGPELLEYTHIQRQRSDAILTTARTILKDNPRLNVRLDGKVWGKPIYVLDRQLTIADRAIIFETSDNLTLFHGAEADSKRVAALTAKGNVCVEIDTTLEGLDLTAAIKHIGQDGIHDLWVEAGGKCFQSLAQGALINEALLYVAPKCLGAKAQSAFSLDEDILATNKSIHWQIVGQDALCTIGF